MRRALVGSRGKGWVRYSGPRSREVGTPPQLTGRPLGRNTNNPSLQLDTTTIPLSKNG